MISLDPDVSSALLDDSINGDEPDTGTLRALRGEEWLENVRLGFGVHAGAGVVDREHVVLAGLHRIVETRVVFVESGISGLDCEFSALRHGVAWVYCAVHDSLVALSGFGFSS